MGELPPVDSRLDLGLGLSLLSAAEGVVELRLDPTELAVVDEGEGAYLHGGALATCVDTAAWYAAESAAPGDGAEWVIAGLSFEGLRLARRPRVIGRASLGRTQGIG